MAEFGPYAGDPGTDPSATLGEDFYMDVLAPEFADPGVVGTPSTTDLRVTANSSGMQVTMAVGQAVARGVGYRTTSTINISIAASTSQPRIDRVVMRFNRSNNTVAPFVIQGTPASSPNPPALVRSSGSTWDVPLAQVRVEANAVTIAADKVTDDREFTGLRVIPTTSTKKNAGLLLREGQPVYESDTGRTSVWTGAGFRPLLDGRHEFLSFKKSDAQTGPLTSGVAQTIVWNEWVDSGWTPRSGAIWGNPGTLDTITIPTSGVWNIWWQIPVDRGSPTPPAVGTYLAINSVAQNPAYWHGLSIIPGGSGVYGGVHVLRGNWQGRLSAGDTIRTAVISFGGGSVAVVVPAFYYVNSDITLTRLPFGGNSP